MIHEFNKSFFFIELRTGCLIIGYTNLINTLILIMALSLAAAGIEEVKVALEDVFSEPLSFPVLKTMLVSSIVVMVFDIALLVGVYLNKRVLVMAYLIFVLVLTALFTIKFFASLVIHIDAELIVTDLYCILLNIYFLLVIKSYYLKMEG